ncbi:hypothetical protein Bbelb_374720 [Branchiostoma belcheri]|nr:hypothetical protein Bbelb_374720 [Branchiostoma belcheri]
MKKRDDSLLCPKPCLSQTVPVPNRACPKPCLSQTVPVPNRACPKPCLPQTMPERTQNGTQHNSPEPCPEVLSIIVIGGARHGLGQGHRVSRTVLCPQARFCTRAECPKPCPGIVWDKAIACPELCSVPRRGLEQGTVWDTTERR